MTAPRIPAPVRTGPRAPVSRAADLLHEARARERAASIPDAIAAYQAAIAAAEAAGEPAEEGRRAADDPVGRLGLGHHVADEREERDRHQDR